MHRTLILYSLLLVQLFINEAFASNFEAVTVTVTIPTNELSDAKAMAAAKNKAVIEAMDKLPAVVWGTETIKNMHYSEYVRSISFAYADVTILQETFDRQAKTLTITSAISWDEQKIKMMLSDVSEGEKAKNTLTQITKLMQSSSLQDYMKVGGANRLTPLEEATLLVNPHFFATSYKELQKLFMETVYQIAKPMTDNLLTIADAIQINLERADNQYLYFSAIKPNTDLSIEFTSQALAEFYQQNKVMIDGLVGELCFFKVDSNQIYSWQGFSKPAVQRIDFQIDTTKIYRIGFVEQFYQQTLNPVEVMICASGAIDMARDINRME